MKKFYPSLVGRLCLTLLFTSLFVSFAHAQIVTYDTTFDGWNAIVTEDLSLHGKDSAAGIIFFPGIDQQTKNINDLTVNGPHYLIKNKMWDGSVTLGNGVHHPFIISLQPPAPSSPATVVKPKIDAILARYRIKRNSLYFTGLSLGSWQANEFITYQPTPGDRTYGRMVRAMVNLEGVEPADYTGVYASLQYPNKMGDWAKACGGRELWVEGSNDWRDMQAGADNMNSAVSGSATYFQVKYGGGAHCCWNTEYEPGVTWTKGSNSNITQVDGKDVPMNVWQWLLRQGDTSMPGGAPAAPAAVVPAVSAGSGQTIALPSNSATLKGSATATGGATIKSLNWKQAQGPANTKIAASTSISTNISGLTKAGSYVYTLTATDSKGKQGSASVTVVVNAAPPPPPAAKPNVSAGNSPTISLPTTSTTLNGSAAGSNGAKISAVAWQQSAGPVTAKIASPASLVTGISNLVTAGTYQFRMTVTDQNGKQAAAVVNVVVKPAPPKAAPPVAAKPAAPAPSPTVNAGSDQTISLPATTSTLKGSATGGNGSKITGIVWQQSQGPANVKFGSTASLTTAVSGLTTAGSYVFRLTVTDQNGKQAAAVTMVTVKSAPVVANTPAPTVSAGKGLGISLPVSSATLTGKASGNGGATIKALTWKQGSGPVAARIASPNSISTAVSGLTKAGSYVFTLTATDSKGKTANGSMTVTVAPAAAKVVPVPATKEPPIVSAGGSQTLTLPANSITLKGEATGRNGAVVNSYFWRMMSGPGWVNFANEWAPSTTVSGLVAGTYVFEFEASDNNTQTASSTVTITVKPNTAKTETGANAAIGSAAMTDPSAADSINHVGGVVIYPNPVHDLLNIRLTGETNGKIIAAVFSMNGTRLQSEELNKESWSLQTSIDVSRLAGGVYVLEIINGKDAPKIERFIKE